MFPPICEKQIILLDSSSVLFKKKIDANSSFWAVPNLESNNYCTQSAG